VRVTKLAEDLGTSREIVSRILESFEAQGFVYLGRGKIRLADTPAIRRQYLD
jgi:CRP-like cAMP-binding protein